MKIVIMTDLEGVAGVINTKDWIYPDSKYYETGKRLLTEEVNAAIAGFKRAGADEFCVIDGHGYGAINLELLDEDAQLSRGWAVYYQFGLNEDYDVIAWVGQHSKSRTVGAHIAHTGSFMVYERRLNGVSVGEYGQYAAIAGFFGKPVIFCSGERAFEDEVKALTPFVHTVSVVRGVSLTAGDECDAQEYELHNLGGVHMQPKKARRVIEQGAYEALCDYINNPKKFVPLKFEAPYTLDVKYRSSNGNPPISTRQTHPDDMVKLYSAPVIKTSPIEL